MRFSIKKLVILSISFMTVFLDTFVYESVTYAQVIKPENPSGYGEVLGEQKKSNYNIQIPDDIYDKLDPFQPVNRAIFNISYMIDRYTIRPIAVVYSNYTPKIMQTWVTNFFRNLGEPTNFVNGVLQRDVKISGYSFFRFLINSTIGLFGLFDVASYLKIEYSPTSFSETFAKYGVPYGPYVVYLFIPGSVLSVVDFVASYSFFLGKISAFNDIPMYRFAEPGLFINIVNQRALVLKYESMIVGDPYTFIRNAYLQRRDFILNKGVIESDPFSDEE